MNSRFRSCLLVLFLFSFGFVSKAQLTVSPTHPAAVLAAKLTGPGITVSSPTLTCAPLANGTFVSVTTPIVIDSGIILSSGRAINTAGNESFLASTNNGTPGDAALTLLAGTTTNDACVLEFDFVPKGDTVSFNYQFGSEEYINSTCGQYNDAFAFFISGPGIVGTQNMALVPGTNIPVTVNSINNGIPGPPGFPGFCNILNCTSMGPGSPFTAYYVDNTGGTQVTYKGYTQKLKAFHQVIPCNTYHLKMAVADASNSLYDSGVFIEAGSLTTNTYKFKRTDSIGHTINGVANAFVKGCAPATITVLNSRATGTAQTVYFTYGGSGVRGADYTAPDSAIIIPGDTSVTISIPAVLTAPSGPKTLEIYLSSPFSCGVVDTVFLNILDAPTASIITPDTSVCLGSSFQIRAMGSLGLVYSWLPTTTLSSASVMQPIASPLVNTTYTMSATLPLAGCPPIVRTVMVTINVAALSIITPDTSICIGASIPIVVTGSPGLAYSWTPASTLNNPSFQSPIATPVTTTTYTVSATSTIGGCPASAQIKITVIKPVVNILTKDTSICEGKTVHFLVSGDPLYQYDWSPAAGLDDPTLMEPTATPVVPTTYTVKVSVPGLLCTAYDKVDVSFLPRVVANAAAAKSVCAKQPIELTALPKGVDYIYAWNGPAGFSSALQTPYIRSAQLTNEGTYDVVVTNTVTGCSGVASVYVAVGDASLILTDVTPNQTIKLGSHVQLNAWNAINYRWTPNDGTLDNANVNNPVATPNEKTTYIVYGTGSNGCIDSTSVTIDVEYDNDVFVPSGFTPNGDGLNDLFRVPFSKYHKLVEMMVFNRWGEQVYHAFDGSNVGWDGTQNGTPAEMGTYNYNIIVSNPDGTLQNLKGTVTLIR